MSTAGLGAARALNPTGNSDCFPFVSRFGLTQMFCVALCAMFLLLPVMAHAAEQQPPDSWKELGFLNFGRFGCRMHAIDGHRALVMAGWGDDIWADQTAEILDTNIGEWTLTSPMPTDFSPGANPWTARLTDDYFLIAGGFDTFDTGDLRSYIYSVSRNTWVRTGDLPTGSTLGSNFSQTDSVLLDDGRVLIASGYAIGIVLTRASLVFKPNYANLKAGRSGDAVGTWDFTRDKQGRITQLNGASEHQKLIKLVDGRVLLIHGYDRTYNSARWGTLYADTLGVQAELFDPQSGKWAPLPNLPAIAGEDDQHAGVKGVRQMAAVALLPDGRVLVSGGFSEPVDNKGRPLLKDVLYSRRSSILFNPVRFDAGTNPWTVTGAMNVPRHSHAMGMLPGAAGILAAGGANTATAEVYDPRSGTWRLVAGLPALPDTDLAISDIWGCTTMMPGGGMLVTGGSWDNEQGGTSRHTYLYRP